MSEKSRLKRPRYPMPEAVEQAFHEHGLMRAYRQRPAYQQNDHLGLILRAKRPGTQGKRMAQLIDELRAGDVYMKMPYRPQPRPG
ncbi:MAG: YdeI/OmpD-associated family protein [Anaerolineales bacterium]|nr:YdeI/OmpD-associated family protein [Anaerolineales bacterium]